MNTASKLYETFVGSSDPKIIFDTAYEIKNHFENVSAKNPIDEIGEELLFLMGAKKETFEWYLLLLILYSNETGYEQYYKYLNNYDNIFNVDKCKWAILILKAILPKINNIYIDYCNSLISLFEKAIEENNVKKEWICQKCQKRFLVPIDEHKRCINSRERIFPTCTFCESNYSMATDVVTGKEKLPKWIKMKNPNVYIHNQLALIREITFDGKGRASDKCCGNCREFTIIIGGAHWCSKYGQEVDQKDLCTYWIERKVFSESSSIRQNSNTMVEPETLMDELKAEKHRKALKLARKVFSVDYIDRNSASLLFIAASKGYFDICRILIDKGAKLNLQAESGGSALLIASQQGHYKIVKLLLDKGAKLDLQATNGWTALIAASYMGYTKIVKMLIDKGADLNLLDCYGKNTLQIACEQGKTKVVNLLLDNGANINIQDDDGWTALMCASNEGQAEVIKLLLDKGANTSLMTKEGSTAYDLAANSKIKTLLSK